jgi:hypothetical protein
MTSGEPARGNAAGSWYGSDGPDRLNSAQKLKHLFRVYCYADARFSPSFKEGDATYRERVSASRMDDDDRHPVICTSMTSYALLGAAKYVGRHLAARRVLFLVWFTSSMRREASARRTLTALSVYRRAFPNHDFVFLCNEEEERIAFAALGMNAILCSHNALADDAFWRPVSGKGQTYDALYNGSMTLQKRRHLARLVPRAAHVFAEVTSFGKARPSNCSLKCGVSCRRTISSIRSTGTKSSHSAAMT